MSDDHTKADADTEIPGVPASETRETPPPRASAQEIAVSRNDSWETLIERLKTLRDRLPRQKTGTEVENPPPS